MTANELPYPPTPPGIPRKLTSPTFRYRLQVILVLVSLLLFVVVYLGLVAGTGYLAWWSESLLALKRLY